MDNKAYLEQISAEARPVKARGGLFNLGLSPKLVKILIGAVVAAVVIIIFGSILSSGGKSENESDYLNRISIRTDNLVKTISSYNNRVKSSELRSLGNSLKAILNEANYQVNTYLKEVLNTKVDSSKQTGLSSDEEAIATELNQTLENARLSGNLDRAYAREFTYQIGMLIALEDAVISRTKNSAFQSDLEASRSSLNQFQESFNNFSGQ